jgi:O-6-methylguanine DNA methyltransferase
MSMSVLIQKVVETPLGQMVAVVHSDALVLLEFTDRIRLTEQLSTLSRWLPGKIREGSHPTLSLLEQELSAYFARDIKQFSVPVSLHGTEFQVQVWNGLLSIPYGSTLSYGDLADRVHRPDAQRAVGKANGDNRIAILVPCHRVVAKSGVLQGYAGGLNRKRSLLDLEQGAVGLFR